MSFSDLDQINLEIIETKRELRQAKDAGDTLRRDHLEVLLTEQLKKENWLRAGSMTMDSKPIIALRDAIMTGQISETADLLIAEGVRELSG